MHLFHRTERLHGMLLYGAYDWLPLSGVLHFVVDVVSQYLRRKHAPSPATTLYYGMNSTYAMSKFLLAALALFAIRQGVAAIGHGYGLALGLLAACAWFVPCLLFVEYPQPRIAVAVFAALPAVVALTGSSLR
ncbi:MAG: hypothetical protein ACRYFU_10875 [Janthinobacterium lividum]